MMGRLSEMVMRLGYFIAGIFLALNLLYSPLARAGWGVGSEFAPYNKVGFDFAMAYPIDWQLEEESPRLGKCAEFGCYQEAKVNNKLEFPLETSEVRVRFYQGLTNRVDELIDTVIPSRHPEIPKSKWVKRGQDGPYYLYITSGELEGKNSNERVTQEYYFIGPGQVIQIESHSYSAGNGLYWVEKIRSSINHSSKGPEVTDISWDKEKYVPGESACLTITVLDSPGAVGPDTLSRVDLEGDTGGVFERKVDFSVYGERKLATKLRSSSACASSTNSNRNKDDTPAPQRNREKSRYQIEIKIQSYFDSTDLRIRNLMFTNRNDGNTICSPALQKEGLFSCINSVDKNRDITYPHVSSAEVSNSSRDFESPIVAKLQVVEDHLLNIEASDKSGIAFVILELDDSDKNTILLFPDQIGKDKWVDLKDKGKWGRNNINRVLVVDTNKLYTVFKANPLGRYECKRSELKKDNLNIYKQAFSSGCGAEFPAISFSGGIRK